MKFKILVLLAILFSSAEAQFLSDYGIKVGMTSSKFNVESTDSENFRNPYDENRLSPTVGLYFRYLESTFIDLESELRYVQKGGENEFKITTTEQPDGTGEYIIFDIQFDYIQLQTSIRPNYSFNNFEIYGSFGISLDYLISVKNSIVTKDQYTDFIWGYTTGLGLTLNNVLANKISLEFLYNSDISEMYKSESVKYTSDLFLMRLGFSLNYGN